MTGRPLLILLLLLGLAAACSRPEEAATGPPNVIVVVTDDHGYADLSCQGVRTDVRTPNLDALAAGGVRMTAAYSTSPQCTPARAGLLVGRYQNRFGILENKSRGPELLNQTTLAERLKRAGYVTGMVGKWHLGSASLIPRHGFQRFFTTSGAWTNFDLDGTNLPPGRRFGPGHRISLSSSAAVAFIDSHHDRPFFLYLAYKAPHFPLDAPRSDLRAFDEDLNPTRRQALAMLSAVDRGVGRIRERLEAHGIFENTLWFFTSDHGAALWRYDPEREAGGTGWNGSLNEPFTGEKGMLSEGALRVPFLVSWPRRLPAGVVYEESVSTLDIAATVLAAADLPPAPELDGVDLTPYLLGDRTGVPHPALFWSWGGQSAVRVGRWKYVVAGTRTFLFDLADDPGEQRDRRASEPELTESLALRLTRWIENVGAEDTAHEPLAPRWTAYYAYYHGDPDAGTLLAEFDRAAREFLELDSDDDMRLTAEEFSAGGGDVDREERAERFRRTDTDADGWLELEEYAGRP